MIALKVFFQFTLKALVFSLVLAVIHYFIATQLAVTLSVEEIFEMHAFIVFLTIVAYGIMVKIGSRDFDKIGFTFAGLVLIKMMVSFAYLYPFLKSPGYEVKEVVLNFFAVYLLFVFFEAREAYLLIQKGPFSPEK